MYFEVPKPARPHLRLTGLRKLGKPFAGLCIKQHYPPLLFQPFTYNLCEDGVHNPPSTHISVYGTVAGLGSSFCLPLWIPPSFFPHPTSPPLPIYSINSFLHYVYPFTWLLCFFNTANVYHLPNRLDRFCFL